MKNRSPVAVALLTLVTFGFYGIYWEVVTKQEMVEKGADIPTAWLIIIPIANLYWTYKYCMGVEKVTNGKMSTVLALVLMLVLSIVGLAIIQDAFNNVGGAPAVAAGPAPQDTTMTPPPAAPQM